MVTDSNGMEDIYPRLANGFHFSMDNKDAEKDNHMQPGGSVNHFVDKGNSFWGVDDPSKVRISLKKFPEAEDSIDGCNMNFADAVKRGYAYKKGDMRDIEVKMILDVRSVDPHVLIGGPTGHHPSNSNPCCQGFSYFARFQNNTPFTVEHGKEMFHNKGYDSLNPATGWYSTRLQNADIGVAYIRYNDTDAGGRKVVVIETWIDDNADGKGWKRFTREVDFPGRGWFKKGAGGDVCGGDEDQVGYWGNLRIRIRWDDSSADVRFKNVCISEIAPHATNTQPGGQTGGGGTDTGSGGGGGGGQSGGTPVPTEPVQGFVQFKFRRNVNFYQGNYCAVANDPVTDPKVVYSQLSSNGVNGSDLDENGDNAGEVCKDKESNLFGVQVTAGTVYLTKIGSGTNVDVVIKDSSNRLKATLATITAGTIGTSETACPFTTSSTYKMKLGDRFGVQEAGSPDNNNYIAVARSSKTSYDGNHSKRYTYLNGDYEEKDGDLKAIIQGIHE